MPPFTIFMICLQACLIQAVFGSCGCGMRKIPTTMANPDGLFSSGTGDIGVFGELPVFGTTTLQGIVPAVGGVEFSGPVSARGSGTITGACAYPANADYAAIEWYRPQPKSCGCY